MIELEIQEIKDAGVPVNVFPLPIKNFIEGYAKGSGSQVSYLMSSVLGACTVVFSESQIEVKPNYIEKPNLFICNVGKPGVSKSPPQDAATRFLTDPQAESYQDYVLKLKEWEKTKKGKKNASPQPEPPPLKVLTGGTMEGVTANLAQMSLSKSKPHCLLMKDELAGFFKSMNAYRQSDDEERWLSLFSGETISIRNKGELTFVKKGRASLLGSTQPDVFREVMEDKGNGMIDRIIFLVYEGSPEKTNIFNFVEPHIIKNYEDYMKSIEFPDYKYKIDNDLRPLIQEFHDWTYLIGDELEIGAFKKWEQIFYRLIIIIGGLWKVDEINENIVKKAISLSKYLSVNWISSKEIASQDIVDILQDEIRKFLTQNKGEFFTARQLYQFGKPIMRKYRKKIHESLNNLVHDQLIAKTEQGRSISYGIPNER